MLEPLEAFGAAGPYDRAALARLYAGRRVRVARGWIERDDRFESITLLSPYPGRDADSPVRPGTMVRSNGRCRGGKRAVRTLRSAFGTIMPEQTIMKMRAWVVGCLFVLCAATEAGAQAPPSEPVVLAGGALTVGGDISATFGSRGPRLLQLHRLRGFRAADAAGRRQRGAPRGQSRCRSSAKSGARMAGGPAPTPCTSASGPGPARRFDIQVGRIPPTFGAFPRRSYESENPLIGYPLAYQYLTSIRADAVPGQRRRTARRCAAAGGWPLTRDRLRDRRTLPACRSSPRSVGIPGCRPTSPTISWTSRRRSQPERCRTRSSATTTPAGRWPAASPCIRSPAWLSEHRPRTGHSSRDTRRRPHPVGRATGRSRRRPGAATSNTPGITISCGSRRSSASGRCRRFSHRSSTLPCERWPRRSRDATSCALACTSQHDSTIWDSARSPARQV